MNYAPPPEAATTPADHLFTVDSSHVVTNGDDWYTPRWIFDAAGITFDMDVASPMDPEMQHVPARRYITAVEDGLTTPWVGMLLVPAVKSRWVGTMLNAADTITLLTVEFHRPGGQVAPIRWLNILAGKECADAVGRVAVLDKHAAGGYFVRGAA